MGAALVANSLCPRREKRYDTRIRGHVSIKLGDKLYNRTLVLVTDPAEMDGVLQVRAKKYPQLKIAANATEHVFHVVG